MFNLPWYAWLNVLALPCLWAAMWLDASIAGRPRWFRQLGTGQMYAAIATLFLNWNPIPDADLQPLHLTLAVLILPLLVWQLGGIVIGAAEIVSAARATRRTGTRANAAGAGLATSGGTDPCGTPGRRGPAIACAGAEGGGGDVLDLDAGDDGPGPTEETVTAWVDLLFHHGDSTSRRTSLETIFPAPGADEMGRHAATYLGASLAYGAAQLAVIGPPAWMSLSMAALPG